MYELLDAPEHIAFRKVFSFTAAFWCGLLSGPLAAAYIVAYNFRAFGRLEKITYTWVAAFLVFVAAFTLPKYVPFLPNISAFLIALSARFAVQYGQADDMNSHLASGGELQPWWVALLIGLLGFLITGVIYAIGLKLVYPEGFQQLLEAVKAL